MNPHAPEPANVPAATAEQGLAAEHVLPAKTYFLIYGALILLTVLTVAASLLELGAVAIYVAMAVAIIKASLVVSYFMHLKFDARFNSLVFLSSLLFLVIFFSLTMIDLGTRGYMQEVQGRFIRGEEKAASGKARPEKKAVPPLPLEKTKAR